jgi:fermentation-respiration switch protein FrsA (DUF1100 family)
VSIATIGYIAWCLVLYFKQDDLIFPRQQAGTGMVPPVRKDLERVWIDADDGTRVEGWFFRTFGATPTKPAPVVVVFHGNGELIDYNIGYADYYSSLGLHVLLVEYRGYGRSGGPGTPDSGRRAAPSEAALVADSMKFMDWLAQRRDVDMNKVVLLGHSLGTGVAAQVAARRRPAAVILESPFTSIASFATAYGAPAFLVKSPFRTDLALPPLAASGVPVLILATRTDEIVPFSHAQRLASLMPSATLSEVGGGHNEAMIGQPAYEEAVDRFLRNSGILGR